MHSINPSNYFSRSVSTPFSQKVCDLAHAGKEWVVTNRRALLVATMIAGLAAMITGFAIMAIAPRIFSTTDIIACTMESCSLIKHFVIDPTFLKGLMTALSGALIATSSRSAFNAACREDAVLANEDHNEDWRGGDAPCAFPQHRHGLDGLHQRSRL